MQNEISQTFKVFFHIIFRYGVQLANKNLFRYMFLIYIKCLTNIFKLICNLSKLNKFSNVTECSFNFFINVFFMLPKQQMSYFMIQVLFPYFYATFIFHRFVVVNCIKTT